MFITSAKTIKLSKYSTKAKAWINYNFIKNIPCEVINEAHIKDMLNSKNKLFKVADEQSDTDKPDSEVKSTVAGTVEIREVQDKPDSEVVKNKISKEQKRK